MGRRWVGFQDVAKPVPGRTVTEQASFPANIADARIVALLTTREGLSTWLAPVTAFSDRRGGNIDFTEGGVTYGGSFTLIDPPRSIVLVTERYGEIAVRIDPHAERTRVDVECRRFIPDTDDADAIIDAIRAAFSRLQEAVQA